MTLPVDRDRVLADLCDLVAIPSITGDETEAADHVASLLEDAGLDVERIDADPAALAADPAWPGAEMPRNHLPLVAGTWRGNRPGPRLLLVGHLDVVPAGDLRTWTDPPFQPVVRDGQVYGRGTCDMKGGVVAALEAIRAVAAAGLDLAGEVVLVGVPSEEDGGGGALAAIRAGFTGDLAIIPEPTRLEVVVAHAGAITFTLDVPGRAAHASTRREGISALDKMRLLLEALAEDERRRNRAETHPLMSAIGLPYPTIVGKIQGGEWASTVLDRVVVEGRYGVMLGQTPAEAAADLERGLSALWSNDDFLSRYPLRLEMTGGRFGSAEIPSDHPLPHSLSAVAERITGRRPAAVGVPYGADMRLFVNEGNTPCVMYGPGDVRHAHAADEHVPLEEVVTCARVLAEWVTQELSVPDDP
jgi:acetylornithine deacetylase